MENIRGYFSIKKLKSLLSIGIMIVAFVAFIFYAYKGLSGVLTNTRFENWLVSSVSELKVWQLFIICYLTAICARE